MNHYMICLPLTCFMLMQCGCGPTEKTEPESEPKPKWIDSVESATLAVTKEVKRFYKDIVSEDEKIRIAAVERLTPTKDELIALFGEENGAESWVLYQKYFNDLRETTEKGKAEVERGGKIVDIQISLKDQGELPFDLDDGHEVPSDAYFFSAVVDKEDEASGAFFYVAFGSRVIFVRP